MNFDRLLFFWLFLAFILSTILGTLSHECGHYLMAKCLGHEAHLHYASTSTKISGNNEAQNQSDGFWITLAGPIQTILTGTIGIVLLLFYSRSFCSTQKLSLSQWVLIFIALFWLRQVANFAIWLTSKAFDLKFKLFQDEIKLARYFEIHDGLILGVTAIIGLFIFSITFFKFIPAKQKATFIAAGLLGGVSGYLIWVVWFGKYIIP